MSLSKPYKRLYRPSVSRGWSDDNIGKYQHDERYISKGERTSLLTAACLIIHDFEELFVYIEPTDVNKRVYSHRVYELFLRTCTEIEANCKGILEANGYRKSGNFDMSDYKKLEQATLLSSYKVKYSNWSPVYSCKPFEPWANNKAIKWYQDYNAVKHDRYDNFSLANMENLMQAICGLLCILHVQFGKRLNGLTTQGANYIIVNSETISVSSFTITPHQWQDSDKYDFDWDSLSSDADAFSQFTFV